MAEKNQLTVLIPCKNARPHIRACVASVQAIADEILIADSGSTDGTLEIVQDIDRCRVIQREYVNPGSFKNWAFPQARAPWIFLLDQDERVTADLASSIRQAVRVSAAANRSQNRAASRSQNRAVAGLPTEPPTSTEGLPSSFGNGAKDAYRVYRQNLFLGHPVRFGVWGRDWIVRLFRRDAARYTESGAHATMLIPEHRIGKLQGTLRHYARTSYDDCLAKMNYLTEARARQWYAAGRRPRVGWMAARISARFFYNYFVKFGFLDGTVGFQVALTGAIGSFMKQAKLWEMCHARPHEDLDAELLSAELLLIDEHARRQQANRKAA